MGVPFCIKTMNDSTDSWDRSSSLRKGQRQQTGPSQQGWEQPIISKSSLATTRCSPLVQLGRAGAGEEPGEGAGLHWGLEWRNGRRQVLS